MTDIPSWLRQLGLEHYEATFRDNGIGIDVLRDLTDPELKELGLNLGDRKRFLKAIAALDAEPIPLDTPTAPREAERRQLTVMFVDLVGSTELSTRLDPEDMRELMRSYQNTVAGEIARFEGHVAQFLGDGVLAYFGWPRAHEDEAERAVHAALAVTATTAQLRTPTGETLQTRIGIATGRVVVGDLIGEGSGQRHAVVGETPNLAARLQGVAEPGTVVIADSTRQLLGDLFDLRELGPQQFKGLAEPSTAYAVLGERNLETRFAARHAGGVTPIVGRDQELGLLIERWSQAKADEGQVVLLSGEAGIGKSRIAEAVVDAVRGEAHYLLRYQCSPYHADSALYPAIQQISHAAGFTANDSPDQRLERLEALLAEGSDEPRAVAPLIAALLGIDSTARYGASTLTPQQRRSRTLAALADQLVGLARKKPVLWVFEDVHWIDPTTLELIELTLDRIQGAPALALITARPSFVASFANHPVVTRLALNRLGRAATQAIVDRITRGKHLPEVLVDEIAARTDGVPLFVEEMTKAVIESGVLREEHDAYHLDGSLHALAIPTTLHDSLMARLDRLQPLKEVAQTAAVIGRSFDHRSIAALSALPEAELADAMQRLVEAELIFRRGTAPEATYLFKHALVRDAAYESLLKAKRIALHGRLLEILEAGDAAPEVMAQHAEAASQIEKSVDYWQCAGERALQRSANLEASRHFSQGIELIKFLPASPVRSRKELHLYLGLGPATKATKGHSAPETLQAFSRSRALIDEQTTVSEQIQSLYGLWGVHFVRGEQEQGRDVAAQVLDLVASSTDAEPHALANRMMGESLWAMGRHLEARHYLERAIQYCVADDASMPSFRFSLDHKATAQAFLSYTLWCLGYPEQALAVVNESVDRSNRLVHAVTSAMAMLGMTVLAIYRRDCSDLERHAATQVDFCARSGIEHFEILGRFGQGVACFWGGEPETGIVIMQAAMADNSSKYAHLFITMHMASLAEAYASIGKRATALELLDEAIPLAARTKEGLFEPELHRLRGELFVAHDRAEAETSFEQALVIARRQGAKSWELRTALSLAKLWRAQKRHDEARELLAPIYGWFTEGFDTPDLVEAKALLEQLQ